MKLSVILPASNEADWIGPCLSSLLASDPVGASCEILVIANGCTDNTAQIARSYIQPAQVAGWQLHVFERPEGGKLGALNLGDAKATGAVRVYLDADVTVSTPLMGQIYTALSTAEGARYASGTPIVTAATSRVTRAYARFWQTLPFVRSPAPGFGLFAVNAEGRSRWGDFPQIISDDTFVRLHFLPHERIGLPATYTWPMVEGFRRLVRVRKRQDQGVAEIAQNWPHLLAREGKEPMGLTGLSRRALADPLGFGTYAAVSLAVRLGPKKGGWTRGR